MLARTPAADVREAPETPPRLREQLSLVESTRAYAASLGLDIGERYTSYVDWPGDRLVTTVVATRPGQVEAAGFTFPIVGRVPYKGFFDVEAATAEAASLRSQGLDVCVVPVDAYSTLGWLDDPITAPMLRRSDAALVETVIHELVHATVFVESQPDFNEGVARFIGQEGAVRFYDARGDANETGADVRLRVEENRLVAAALLAFRDRVAALYEETSEPATREERRTALEAAEREELAALPLRTRDASALAASVQLNDACLALRGTYAADDRRHAALLRELDGDLAAFVARLRQAAASDDPRESFFDAPREGALAVQPAAH